MMCFVYCGGGVSCRTHHTMQGKIFCAKKNVK